MLPMVFVDNMLVGAAGTEERESVLGDVESGKVKLKRVVAEKTRLTRLECPHR